MNTFVIQMQDCTLGRRQLPRGRALSLTAALVMIMAAVGCGQRNQDRLPDTGDGGTSRQSAQNSPDKRCSSQNSYELVKRELFRRAARVRGDDDPTFEPVVAGSSLSLSRASARTSDNQLGSITCTANAVLTLPAGMVAAGGRTTLAAELSYVLQQAADQSGQVATLTNADSITVPLATIARGAQVIGRSSVEGPAVAAANDPQPSTAPGPSPETRVGVRPSVARPTQGNTQPIRATTSRRQSDGMPALRTPARPEAPVSPSRDAGGWRVAQVVRQGPLNTKIYVDEGSLERTSDGRVRVRTKYVGTLEGQSPVQTITDETIECSTGYHTQHSYLVQTAQGSVVSRRGAQPRKKILPNAMLRGLMNRLCS